MSYTLIVLLSIINVISPLMIYIALAGSPPGVRWGIAAGVFVLIFLLCGIIYKLYRKRVMNILMQKCDPDRFTQIWRRAVEHPFAFQSPWAANEARLYMAMGLQASGSFDEAVGVYNNVNDFQKTRRGNLLELARRCFKIDLLLHYKDFTAAQTEIGAIEALLQKVKRSVPKMAAQADKTLRDLNRALRSGEEADAEDEKQYTEMFQNAESTLSRVTAKYNLGLYYERRGEKEKAAEAFKYAADNGNKLYIAKESAKKTAGLAAE